MSLMERAERKSSWVDDQAGSDPLYAEFCAKVRLIMPSQRVARLIERSPGQARSEVRGACEEVLRKHPWLLNGMQGESFTERYLNRVFGMGPLETLICDDSVTEIMVNGAHSVFFEREGKLVRADQSFEDDDQVKALIDRILAPLGRRIDESSPMVNARLSQGHRVNAVIPPLALDGPILTIRKFRAKVFELSELREMGTFDLCLQRLMEWAVLRRCNIAVSGGTGSGKTTLLNALSCVIPDDERIVTIEDSAELRFLEHPHVVRLEARPCNAEGVGEVSIRDLVINSLRMRPDRIVVGECRGAEALDMLQAMNTGHDGSLTTLHANTPKEAISRLTTMVRYAVELPVGVIESQVASAIDLVIQTTRRPDGSRIVNEVAGYRFDEDRGRCVVEEFYQFDPLQGVGTWVAYPSWVDGLAIQGIAQGWEVEQWKRELQLAA